MSRRLSEECCLLGCLARLPTPLELRCANTRHLAYPRCETFNRWCSVDAHFRDGAERVSLPLLRIQVAKSPFMTMCNQSPHKLPKMQDQESLTLPWRWFPGWGRERVFPYCDYKGGWYIQTEKWPTIVNILHLTIRLLNVTINSTTWNAEPEIGTDESSQTQWYPRIGRYGSMFAPPRSRTMGLWTGLELNRIVFPVYPLTAAGLPGNIANTIEEISMYTCRVWTKLILMFYTLLVFIQSDPSSCNTLFAMSISFGCLLNCISSSWV